MTRITFNISVLRPIKDDRKKGLTYLSIANASLARIYVGEGALSLKLLSDAMKGIIENQREKLPDAPGPFPFLKNTVSQSFRRARRAAGIHKGHFHALRDTAAVWMLQSGVSIYHVKNILGHSSVRVTERYYGHMVIDDLRSALDTLGTNVVRISSEKSGKKKMSKDRNP